MNTIYQGDNKTVLEKLLKNGFSKKVKLIVTDPPYNTKSKANKKGFIYNDSMGDNEWGSFIKERVELAYKLLSDDGYFCIFINTRQVHYLKCLLDTIFGRDNFVQQVTYKVAGSVLSATTNPFCSCTEFILIYKKSKKARFNRVCQKTPFSKEKFYEKFPLYLANEGSKVLVNEFVSADKQTLKIYRHEDYKIERSKTVECEDFNKLFYTSSISPRLTRLHFIQNSIPDVTGLFSTQFIPTQGKYKNTFYNQYIYNNKNVVFSFENFDKNFDKNVLYDNLITDLNIVNFPSLMLEGNVKFNFGKKPEKLLSILLEIFSNKEDLVMDIFAGSGSVAAVAHKMGREYLMIEKDRNTVETILVKRLLDINNDQRGISKEYTWDKTTSFEVIYE